MRRPILRYHGGKWKLAPWIISHFPEHRVYVEPYGGGGSVLLRKPRSYAEIYNDLDGEVVNVFQMARDRGSELKELLRLTPFSKKEFKESYQEAKDPLEQARKTITRAFMGFGSNAVCAKNGMTGFRADSNRSGTTPARDWKNYAEIFDQFIERLRGVVIENRDALEVMEAHDSEETLHYVDPPYVFETRTDPRHGYKHEMTAAEHEQLADFLRNLKGQVVLSGYSGDLYSEIFGDWERIDKATHKDGAREAIESLWFSPQFQHVQGSLL